MSVIVLRDLPTLATAPSPTEQEKAARTHNLIREHLESDPSLGRYRVSTYLQGSYKNSTNVRGDSDVDMGCATDEVFFYDLSNLPDTVSPYQTKSVRVQVEESFSTGSFSYWDYRRDVYASLKEKYGTASDGKKAIKIDGNTYRLDADVLPCIQHRQYYTSPSGSPAFHEGIAFLTLDHKKIVNFPKQHYENLKNKDQANDGKVKGCVRIIKRIRNEMEEAEEWDRKHSPSFYIESLIWNVPDSEFRGGYDLVFQRVLAHLWNDLREKKMQNRLNEYIQASKIFYLFHSEFWNADDAIEFIGKIWNKVFQSRT